MTSFYPRTEVLLDALAVYKRALLNGDSTAASAAMIDAFAEAVVGAFDK